MQVHRKLSAEPKTGARTSCLSMYSVPPTEKLSVTEFEEFAYDRLRLLNVIDMARAKGLKGPDLEKAIRKGRDDCMPNTAVGQRKDRFSHFILRLAYCRSEDLRRWFLQNEVELFKWRFVNNPPDDMNLWLKGHSMNYEAISKDEAATLREPLLAAFMARPHPKESDPMSLFERQEHYKVGFEQVLDLVRQRRVYLEGGFAYVPASDLVSIVANQVRMHLSKQLSSMARAWPALREEESERLSGFLESLATQCRRLSHTLCTHAGWPAPVSPLTLSPSAGSLAPVSAPVWSQCGPSVAPAWPSAAACHTLCTPGLCPWCHLRHPPTSLPSAGTAALGGATQLRPGWLAGWPQCCCWHGPTHGGPLLAPVPSVARAVPTMPLRVAPAPPPPPPSSPSVSPGPRLTASSLLRQGTRATLPPTSYPNPLPSPRYVGDDFSQPRNGGVKVSIADLPMLSRRAFPRSTAAPQQPPAAPSSPHARQAAAPTLSTAVPCAPGYRQARAIS